jgi:hypothetical protein
MHGCVLMLVGCKSRAMEESVARHAEGQLAGQSAYNGGCDA